MKIPMPQPGHPSGARLVTGLSVASVVIALGGLAVTIGSAITGEVAYIVVGVLEIVLGSVLFVVSRAMAEVERTLADLRKRSEYGARGEDR